MTPLADQQLAGLLMIAAGLDVFLVAAMALSIPWLRSTKREA
jgi:cytochrome c oxidase assembly factor CtaG